MLLLGFFLKFLIKSRNGSRIPFPFEGYQFFLKVWMYVKLYHVFYLDRKPPPLLLTFSMRIKGYPLLLLIHDMQKLAVFYPAVYHVQHQCII